MDASPIYLSTRAAARFAGLEPHVLYSHFRRRGHWCGVVPVKDVNGRLHWPAEAVQEATLPPPDQWPNGLNEWIRWAKEVSPSLGLHDSFALGCALLASDATPGWVPAPGQLGQARLRSEGGLVALFVQAWRERADLARTLPGQERVAELTEKAVARVCAAAFRYTFADEQVQA
jgi:hypothetical protein